VVTDGDTLVEGLHDGKFHDSAQVGLSGEDEDEGVVGVHLEVGQQPELFQGAGLKEVGFVDDEEDGFAGSFFGLQEGRLDLIVDGALGEPRGETEEPIDVVEEVGAAEGGKRGVEGLEQIFVEAVHVSPEGDGFAHPRISGEEEYSPSTLDVVEACGALLEGVGVEEILSFDVLVEGESFQTEPGEEVFHGKVLPLWKERVVGTF
jgi:hypothetical protein